MEVKLNFLGAAISYIEGNAVQAWYEKDANGYPIENLPSSRSGSDRYYCTRLKFSTESLSFVKSTGLKLELTTKQTTSYPYGTSAIISKRELTEKEIYNVITSTDLSSIEGVAWSNCTEIKDNVGADKKQVFSFDNITLQVNSVYYIYLKRRLGLGYSSEQSKGYFCAFYNPVVERFSEYSSLTLFYDLEPTYPSSAEAELIPENSLVNSGKVTSIQFELKSKTPEKNFQDVNLSWSIHIYDELGQQLSMQDAEKIANLSSSGLLTIFNGGSGKPYKIVVSVEWGTGSAKYDLSASVRLAVQWQYLNDWIVGYIMGQFNSHIQLSGGGENGRNN